MVFVDDLPMINESASTCLTMPKKVNISNPLDTVDLGIS